MFWVLKTGDTALIFDAEDPVDMDILATISKNKERCKLKKTLQQ